MDAFQFLSQLQKLEEQEATKNPEVQKKECYDTCENMPKGVCSVLITWPLPPQVEHILILEPIFAPVPVQTSQVSRWESSNSFSEPKIASENSKVIS